MINSKLMRKVNLEAIDDNDIPEYLPERWGYMKLGGLL